MTKPLVSFHHIELLSAYLDGQLNPRQRESLEARLRTQPSLTKELETLQKTRQMLRSLPPLRAPRNFSLSAQKYRKQAPARLPVLFGAVSALSSAVLIMLVIGSLFLGQPAKQASLTEELQAYPVAMEASVPEEDLALSMTQKNPAETELAASSAGPVSEDSSRIANPTPEMAIVPPAAEASTLALTPTPTLEGVLASGFQETATPTAYPTHTATQPTPTPLPYEVALPGVTVGVSGGEATPEGVVAKIPEATASTQSSPMATTLLVGEIILASVALISGLVALVLLIRLRR